VSGRYAGVVLAGEVSVRKFLVAIGLVLALVSASGATATAITNGVPTGTDHGYTAALLVAFTFDDDGVPRPVEADADNIQAWAEVCSGVLITPTRVATAGHCAMGIPTEYGVVHLGVSFAPDLSTVGTFDSSYGALLRVNDLSQRPLPATIHAIPNFDLGAVPNGDLGLVELMAPVQDVTPVTVAPVGYLDALARKGRLTKATFTTVGYGASFGEEQVSDLVPSWDPARKLGVGAYSRKRPSSFMLKRTVALHLAGPCFGDSGGPVLHKSNGKTVLVGIISTGDGSCRATTGVARVDVSRARTFLLSP
jgi:hypothetical protein